MSLLDNLRTSSPGRQAAVAVIAAVLVVAVLVAGYFLFLRKPYEVLFTNLRTMDAATIVAELDKKKIPYRLKDDGTTILVQHDQVDATRLDVMSSDLPLKGMVGFELFNKSDMGLTEFAQRINYQRALQGELARTIMTMDAVDTARIHLTIPEETIFRGDRRPPKASVTVVPRPGKALAPATVKGIQRLVAASVADLDIANVVVLDEHGAVVSGDTARAASAETETPERLAIEQHFETRVRQMLERVYAAGDVDVSVWADLDTRKPWIAGAPRPPAWPDGPRDFRLRVAVNMSSAVPPEARDEIRNMTAEAIGLDTDLGDLITVADTPLPAVAAEPAPAPVQATAAAAASPAVPAPRQRSSLGFWIGLVVALLTLPVLAILVMNRRGAAPRAMSARQRAEYTERLGRLLEKGDGDVAPV